MVEPASEVWIHGLLPGCTVTEASLKELLSSKQSKLPTTADHSLGLEQWTALAEQSLKLSKAHAMACMRLCFVLAQPTAEPQPMPGDDELRMPLGSLLLLLWVQWAHHELGESCATNAQRAQAASGEVWPSLHLPPAAAAATALVDGNSQPSARTLAVQSRLHSASQLARRRRKLLQSSLPTLVHLVGMGAERLYAAELDRMSLLLRPDDASAARLLARSEPPNSLSASLGLFSANPNAALPVNAVVAALRAALVDVGGKAAAPAPATSAGKSGTARSPLATAPSASANAPAPGAAADGAAAPPPTPNTPHGAGSPPTNAPPFRISVSTSDIEDGRTAHEGSPTRGSLVPCSEGARGPGAGVLRLHGAKKRTLCFREKELCAGSLQLIDCHGCYIYVLAPLRSAELLGCTGCTVVLGAVSAVLSASHCQGMKLLATAKAARLSNCHDAHLHLCLNSPPLVFGENHRLYLAPFATVYKGLAEHMVQSRLSPALCDNCWDQPIAIAAPSASSSGATTAADDDASTPPCCAVLPPAKFLPFHVPMDVPERAAHGEGVAPYCELPTAYSTALLGHVTRLAHFRDEIGALMCSDAMRREVQKAIGGGFHEWLQRTGNIRQVADLSAQGAW